MMLLMLLRGQFKGEEQQDDLMEQLVSIDRQLKPAV